MKYKLMLSPMAGQLLISVNKRLLEGTLGVVDAFSCEKSGLESQMPKLMKELLKIDGIVNVAMGTYDISLSKGMFFEWKDIVNEAIPLIAMHLSPEDGEAEFIPAPAQVVTS